LANDLFEYSTILTGAEWPAPNQPKSPTPTLKAIGAVTDMVNRKAEKVGGGSALGSDAFASSAVGGGAAKLAQPNLRGGQATEVPTEAVAGSIQTGSIQEEGKGPKRRFGFIRRVFGRGGQRESEGQAEAEAVAVVEASTEDLEGRLDAAFPEGRLEIGAARARLEDCLGDECETEEEATELRTTT